VKIIITGASGFIGRMFFKSLNDDTPIGTSFRAQESHLNILKVDLSVGYKVWELFENHQPEILFHFAALTSPQDNEKNQELAIESNLKVTQNIVHYLPKQSHLVFLSTDKVFDGSHTCPDEDDKTNPCWMYGKLKLQCEELILEKIPRNHILRLPIVHSLGNRRSKAFIDKAMINLKKRESVDIFNNVERCYVKLNELIEFLHLLKNDEHYGVYHLGSQMMSYYERVRLLCDANGIEWQTNLAPKEGNVVPLIQNLNTDKVKRVFNFTFS
jgi:dTDP-4-dehydrorhamnose reductase